MDFTFPVRENSVVCFLFSVFLVAYFRLGGMEVESSFREILRDRYRLPITRVKINVVHIIAWPDYNKLFIRRIIMCRKLICLFYAVLVMGLILISPAKADLVGWWRFDDGSGTTAVDSSGNGNDGTLENAAGMEWAEGIRGGALSFDGTGFVNVPAEAWSSVTTQFTIAFWIFGSDSQPLDGWCFGAWGGNSRLASCHIPWSDGTVYFDSGFTGQNERISKPAAANEYKGQWRHWTFVKNAESGWKMIYLDGVLWHSGTGFTDSAEGVTEFYIGAGRSSERYPYTGLIDDFRLYNSALTEGEILAAMEGSTGYPYALSPNPADGTLYPETWVTLSWKPGDYTVSHDLYLGENFDDVNEATRDSDVYRGNLDLNTTFYIAGFPGYPYPDGLVNGTTYYWRIDEVNEADPNSPWKGDVWSFSIPPKTAYYPVPADGAEFVLIDAKLTWTAGSGAKLHYIVFGDDFDEVNNTAQGTLNGTTSYNPGPLKLAKTYYWRVDESDGASKHKGEVWSFTTEGAVSGPNPTDGAVDVKPSVILSWDAGAVAASHNVYFGIDTDAVKNATTASPEFKGTKALGEESYDPGKLTLNTTYYWRIDEVNDASPDSPWPGNVWSFSTGDFFVIDDFEDYNAGDNQIWYVWHDGLGAGAPGSPGYVPGNGTGSAVGDETTASYTEEIIVHGGNQSMPIAFDNNKQGFAKYSEVELTLADQRDWTEEGVTELSLWFRGYPGSVGSFTEAPVGTYTMTGSGADIWTVDGVEADEFHYAFKTLTGTGSIVARVQSVDNTNVWAKAGVMIRETLDPESAHAMMVVTPGSGVSFQRRPGRSSASTANTTADITAPYWVKIERDMAGNFSAYSSANGTTWQKLGLSEPIQMGTNVYIGLVVTAHNASATCRAVFTNVTITGNVGGQWTSQDIGIESNDPEPLYVSVYNNADAPAVVVHDDPAAAQVDTWTEWVIPLQALADQGINLTNVDKIAIGLGTQGNMTTAGGSGKMYIDDIRLYQP